METFHSRLNTLFAFTLTILGILIIGVFLSTFFEDYHEKVHIETNKPIVEHAMDESRHRKINDLGDLQLNLNMNLKSLFNWNVRSVFVYLIAEYVTPTNSLNQIVLWNKTIVNGGNSQINLQDIKKKYAFWDDGEYLRSTNVTLSVEWNIVSNAGRLQFKPANGSTSFIFPDQYETKRFSTSKVSVQQ